MAAYVPTDYGTFTGSDPGDPSADDNWGGDAPDTGDKALIQNISQQVLAATPANMDMHLVELAVLHLARTMSGNVGESGVPWYIDATNFYFESGAEESWFDGEFTNLYVNSDKRGTNALQLNTENAETIANLILMRGRPTIGSAGTVTTALVMATSVSQGILVVSGGTVGTVNMDMGQILWANNGGTPTVNMGGGELVQTGGTITTCNMFGGRFILKAGTVGTINIYGASAILDLEQLTGAIAVTTINLCKGAYLRPDTLALLSGSVTINYRTPGEHLHVFGVSETWS